MWGDEVTMASEGKAVFTLPSDPALEWLENGLIRRLVALDKTKDPLAG